MEPIDLLFFPGVVIAVTLIWALAAYDKKLASERNHNLLLRTRDRAPTRWCGTFRTAESARCVVPGVSGAHRRRSVARFRSCARVVRRG
jgi:hypothetical protein